ncbi:RPII140-upstream gene protein-like [Argopecten irradians]|uniref:RPII140-upstream gene protein-like n=1 Tax=Argopecten irradians TaxID=31199 RepID=UPI0037114BFB
MDPFRTNPKEIFKLKSSIVFYSSQYSVTARWQTRKFLKFPHINICAPKPSCLATLKPSRNPTVVSSGVLPSEKQGMPMSYSVYQKLRSCLQVPVLLANTNPDVLPDVEANADIPIVSQEEVMEYINKETGKDRLRDLFYLNAQGARHPQLEEIKLTFLMGTMLGASFGFPLGYRIATVKFMEENRGTTFRSKYIYERYKIDKGILAGMKMGAKGGLYAGTFMTLILGLSTTIAVYRNQTSFVEYSISTSVAGALYRLHMGLKGMTAGGIVGAMLGTIGGVLLMGVAKAAGETQENRHYKYIEEKLAIKKEFTREIMEPLEG